MDPNATLRRIRELIGAQRVAPLSPEQTDDLVEAIDALDGWLVKGGFMPDGWTPFGSPTARSAISFPGGSDA